ncbi:maltose alpha-D-glucosyltransferase [Telmatospirillum sp. J64-1]|uniref:maltose alpha-D-glucosyltransferase n=1 Tax=Telmatospirillum sp. J64-1 TaxID=2502183 RepID=UPI00115F2B9F|nr:maltose alpha-D-glucosyltransferase [Telmatospirillum sp. J64-1]
MADDRDPYWYKDAVIYQLHVKSYYDSDGDGVGDFKGLTQKLDYIQSLGVDTLWILPFYPSPLRDDGYDIADYRNVNPAYGTMKDFRTFVREAHARGLRVLTELVVNHTSDQHPWFQRARRAKPGTIARDYYVWSQTHEKYAGTRIIFTDTEKSNWTWDDEAQAYYWHRFFHHQPDLNFDNPRVVEEVIKVMRYWLDAGVDGMRLDAVPYLCEREGTNNENLPETHAVLKKLRAALDESHPGRIFLAEANQWPEDVLPYFGDGDECHMAFHFPLMPRMYMAIAREDRHPITDIMRQTPDIPENCQWAIFLRNHDELTLEMVTDRERDYLWSTYAADQRARINVGIRRRLAPLMDNDRRKIELLNSLLLSMPGTPILYYGDELGMGDNIYLGDRNSVRTPMQWSEDRNGGFSRCDPARLFLPVIMDPVYGYRSVNVEAQQRNSGSLLNWTRRLVQIRQGRKTFGRGTLRFLYPSNRSILAYLRQYKEETILCVCNLSRSAQGVELDLSEFKGRVPVEMTGRSAFPPIGDLPYFLTLPGYGFFWFQLAVAAEAPAWHEAYGQPAPEMITLVMRKDWGELSAGTARRTFQKDILPSFLPAQRWYAEKDSTIASTELMHHTQISRGDESFLMALVNVRRADGHQRTYQVPLAMVWGREAEDLLAGHVASVVARLRWGPETGAIYDATTSENFALALFEAIRHDRRFPGSEWQMAAFHTRAIEDVEWPEELTVRRSSAEQSNTSLVIGERAVLKLIRRPESGPNPELEMGRFLTEVGHFANTPPLLGGIGLVDSAGRQTVLAMMHAYVANQGDAWAYTTGYVNRYLDDACLLPLEEAMEQVEMGVHADFLDFVRVIGQRTAELHRALATPSGDPDFEPEPITSDDIDAWRHRAREQAQAAMQAIKTSDLAEARWLHDRAGRIYEQLDMTLPEKVDALRTRLHGDYHLGQLLFVKNDVYVIDFEGEPTRSLEGRRGKDSPLRDVAGILRSFNYAAWYSLFHLTDERPELRETLEPLAHEWERRVNAAFLSSYVDTMRGCRSCPEDRDQLRRLLHLFLIEKACYEISYEAGHRPSWLAVPVKGLIKLLNGEEAEPHVQTD